jgi:hypothetical protein
MKKRNVCLILLFYGLVGFTSATKQDSLLVVIEDELDPERKLE